MNALVLGVLLVVGQPGQPAQTPASSEALPQTVQGNGSCESCTSYDGPCTLRGGVKSLGRLAWDWFGPMPQTCYQPRFGCYPGNARDIHRYPAFHGYYYRQPYNYRHYFEYPWHAQPHEPLGYFAYPQIGESLQEKAAPIEAPPVPAGPAQSKSPSSAQWLPTPPRPLPVANLMPSQPIKALPMRN